MAKVHVAEYLEKAAEGFRTDPPDSDFQDGYMAAVTTIRAEADLTAVPHWVAEYFASIKESLDSEETILAWRTADEALKLLDGEQVSA